MAGPRLYSEEEVTHQAYDIFLELAPDNLSEQDIADFNEHREELGFIEEGELVARLNQETLQGRIEWQVQLEYQ